MSRSRMPVILICLLFIALLLGGLTATGLLHWGEEPKQHFQSKGKLEVVCEVEVSRLNEGLTQPFEIDKITLPAEFDFDEKTGWYTGEFTISKNRKGSLKVDGPVLEIYRPAMFKRFGLIVLGEHVTLDRTNGEFKQWIDLEGEKRLDLITGRCKRTTNAPF
jgi:hypothetical protein